MEDPMFNFAKALKAVFLLATAVLMAQGDAQQRQQPPQQPSQQRPNIIVIWGDDIGQSNLSVYSKGLMGYRTPNIDRIANEGMIFTDYYGEQSCTAGRAAFITGQSVFRTGLSKVGFPGATLGMQAEDRSEEHTSELQSLRHLVCRLLLEKKK